MVAAEAQCGFIRNVFLPSFSVLTCLPSTTPYLSNAFLPIHLATHRPLWAPWPTQFRPPSIQTQNQLTLPQRWRILASAAPAARNSSFTNNSYPHLLQLNLHGLYAAMLHRSSCRRAAFSVNTLHITERWVPWSHRLDIVGDVTTLVRSPSGTLEIFEGVSGATRVAVRFTEVAFRIWSSLI